AMAPPFASTLAPLTHMFVALGGVIASLQGTFSSLKRESFVAQFHQLPPIVFIFGSDADHVYPQPHFAGATLLVPQAVVGWDADLISRAKLRKRVSRA